MGVFFFEDILFWVEGNPCPFRGIPYFTLLSGLAELLERPSADERRNKRERKGRRLPLRDCSNWEFVEAVEAQIVAFSRSSLLKQSLHEV